MQVDAHRSLNPPGASAGLQPLSPVQEGLWFMQRLAPLSTAYHLSRAFHLRGPLDIATLDHALRDVRGRQAALRTRFVERDGTPWQIADLPADTPLSVVDLSALSGDARQTALEQSLAEDAQRPFDLATEGAARFRVLSVAADWHVLSVVVHHLVSDGGSTAIFAREFAHAYRRAVNGQTDDGRADAAPQPEWQYTDFAAWQRNLLTTAKARADLAWWTDYIGVPNGSFELPTDSPRAPTSDRVARTHTFAFSDATLDAVRARCKAERCTPFVALMAAYQLLLSRHAGSADFCIGVPTSGRTRVECEDLIGLFIDTQVYRARIDPSMTGRALLQAVRHDTRAALDHADVTLPVLVDALGVRREADRHPLFQTLFNVQGAASAGALTLDGLDVEIVDFESPLARFDLSVDIRLSANGATCTARYDGTLYRAETIARLFRHYEAMLAGLCRDPAQPVAEIPYLDADERAQLLAWSTQHAQYGAPEPVHRRFERQADATPDAVALLFDGTTLTYRELDRRANQLAHRLMRLGVGPDVKVGIGVERSVEMVVGLFAILKAGGAYVPLDPDYPPDRLAYMIDDSGIGLLLTQHAIRERLASHLGAHAACEMLELDTLDLSGEPDTRPDVPLHAENLAYVIYTSGSTGRPKGAANRHGALFNRLAWMQAAYRLDAHDTVLQKTPFSFDVSVWEFFWPLMYGARLAVARPGDHRDPSRLVALIDAYRVTTLHFVPPMLQAFVASLDGDAPVCRSLRHVICSGEALPATLQDRALQRLPHVQVHNLYGPTEAAIDVTHWTCRAGDPVVPIGRPIANVSTHVLDGAMNPLPVGVAGELYLGGAGLARGYLNRPSLTAERFVPDPFEAGARLYRTGDLARWRADGALDYLGRLDHQVKIRGFRIELGEIEAVLQTQQGVDAAVVVAQDGPNGKRLVAYVTARDAQALQRDTLAAGLGAVLPDYMVPTAWVELDRLPLSPNGKVDRRALPLPERTEPADSAWEAPQGDAEIALAAIWQQVLRVPKVGRHDNFFELGGDSILSLQIVDRARVAGFRLTPRHLFERQSVAQLAAVAVPVSVDPAANAAHAPVPDGPAALLPMQAWFFDLPVPLAQRHHWNQAVLLTSREPLDTALLARALHALVQHHDALRLRFSQDAAGAWHARHADAPSADTLLWVRQAGTTDDIAALCDDAQRGLDLNDGPLLRALAIDVADGSARLLLAIHHLAVDGVSWRLLVAQLRSVYAALQRGEPVALPANTASTDAWAARLARYATTSEARDQMRYWLDVAAAPAALPSDMPDGANTVAHRRHATLELDRIATQKLLQDAPAAYRTQVNDLLLTALGRALCDWTGSERIRIDLEGHGREDLFDDIDISGTVGWFTSLYPVALEPQGELGAALRRVKETLRAVPDRGLGFGVLKYLGGDADRAALAAIEPSRVVFNYLGQFDQSFDDNDGNRSAWLPAREPSGRPQADDAPLTHALSVSGKVLDGALTLTLGYSGARYRESTVDRLVGALRAALNDVIAHCTGGIDGRSGPSGATPSDFELAGLTQTELDRLPLTMSEVADLYPLSPMQAGMLFHTLYARGGSVYLNQLRADLDGLDPVRFRAAWAAVTRRHDMLRTAFVPQGEGWLQWVARAKDTPDVPLVEHDWRDRPDLRTALDTLASAQLEQGFDLTRAPLHRLALVRTGERRYHFVWTHHHVLMDGWSVSQLLGEVLRHYSGQSLPAHGGRYRDYIGWLRGHDAAASAAHWREQIARIDGPTRLADAFGNRAARDTGYGSHNLELDASTTADIVAWVRRERVTVNTLMQAAWALLLQRYTNQPAVTFGATLAGRPADLPGASHLLGLFINTLPVIATPRASVKLGDWLRELQQQGAAAQEHAHTPLYEIQRWAGVGGQGLFDSIVVFENYPVDAVLKETSPGGLRIDGVQARDETSYALTLGVTQGDTLKLGFRFARDAFGDDAVASIAHQMAGLLRDAAAGSADRVLGEFDLLDRAQRSALLALGRADVAPFGRDAVHAKIETRAAEHADALALVAGETRLTYGELNTRANRLAHRLMRDGVGPEVRVGIAVGRSVEMVVGMLAVLKAGGVYVPLDPAYPADRLGYMIDDSGIRLLIAHSAVRAAVPTPTGMRVLEIDTLDLSGEPDDNPPCRVHPDNLAYVIYTSGSTGRPKGVGVAHGALSMHCQAIAARYDMTSSDRELHFASINFDIAHERWIVPLSVGGALVIADAARWSTERLAAEIRRCHVTVVFLTPSYLNNLLSDPSLDAASLALRLCIVGGEAWAADAVKAACRALGDCRVISAYGPTETVIAPTAWDVDPAFDGLYAPIGRQIGERVAYVLDAGMNLTPRGVAGELYLGGAGLARGYLQRAALSAERFVPDPFDADGGRLYRTGDLVRWRDDGELEYLGRLDHQVKLRGFRIELGEVEAALLAQDGVREAVVIVDGTANTARLIAYVTADLTAQPADAPDSRALKSALAQTLPDYMVPAAIVVLDALPLTPNGKVDRRALPAPQPVETQDYVAPQGATEEAVAAIWREVLGVARVGRHDNFFELGGDSILSLKVQRRIAREMSVEIELAALFSAPTLEAFTLSVDNARARDVTGHDPVADTMQSLLTDLMQ